jgi:hypothetical protein
MPDALRIPAPASAAELLAEPPEMRMKQSYWNERGPMTGGARPDTLENSPLLSILGCRHFSVTEALHDQRHPGRRHQWSGHLIEELVGIFLLGKRQLQELDSAGIFSCCARLRAVV